MWAVLIIIVCVFAYRFHTLGPNELAWDVFGYYLPLPATFVHHDPLLNDIGWVHALMKERPISGTLYQITSAPDGHAMYFFLIGMSILYLPFFFIGHVISALTGEPMDGFSPPYQSSIALGFAVYTLLGLLHWRKVLLHFFPDRLTSLVLLLIAFGTNWFHFMTLKNLETANALFMLMAVLVWNTIEWHRSGRIANVLWVAASLALITLVKPSEVLAGLIPLLWGVHDSASARAKWSMLRRRWKQVAVAIGVGLLVMSPQLLYWHTVTGSFVFDSYKNPGIGLDLWSPHVVEVLFSYRKGWLLYTPIMLVALVGFIFLYREQRRYAIVITVWCGVAFWVLASWTEWWYGASYSVRPMITLYVLLSVPFGLCLQAIRASHVLVRLPLFAVIGALVLLNLFQTWQHHHLILDPYRTTKAYYWAIFGRTTVPVGAEKLKSVERPFTEDHVFTDPENYRRVIVGRVDFEGPMSDEEGRQVIDSAAASTVFRLDGDAPFSQVIRSTYGDLTDADHAWVHASMKLFVPKSFNEEMPCLVFTIDRKEGSYGYKTRCPDPASFALGQWNEVSFNFMLPPVRDDEDELKCYAWCRSRSFVLIDDLELDIFIPKQEH